MNGEGPDVLGILAAHNAVREPLGVPPLVYDGELAEIAALWIDRLDDEGCDIRHDYSSPLGENLYWTSATSGPQAVVDSWASEVAFYDYDTNRCEPGEMCGHYTQLVWAETERVGCAQVQCAANAGQIWMCTYDPAGNAVGQRPY